MRWPRSRTAWRNSRQFREVGCIDDVPSRPGDRGVDDQHAERTLATRITPSRAGFGGRKVAVLGFEGNLVEVFRPVAEPAGLVEFGGLDPGGPILLASKKPVQSDEIGIDHALGDEGLDGEQEERAMRLGHDSDTAVRGIDQEPRHGDLGPRMQVDLGLLDVDKLPRVGGPKGDHDRQRLRNAEPHVGDADQVAGAPLLRTRHSTDAKLDLRVVDRFRLDLPGETEQFEIVAQLFDLVRRLGTPVGDQACHVVLERARKPRPNRRHRIGSFGIAPQTRQMNEFQNASNNTLERLSPQGKYGRKEEILAENLIGLPLTEHFKVKPGPPYFSLRTHIVLLDQFEAWRFHSLPQ